MLPRKKGRPTDNPKLDRVAVRLDAESSEILHKYCEQTNTDKAEAVRQGIKKLKSSLK